MWCWQISAIYQILGFSRADRYVAVDNDAAAVVVVVNAADDDNGDNGSVTINKEITKSIIFQRTNFSTQL